MRGIGFGLGGLVERLCGCVGVVLLRLKYVSCASRLLLGNMSGISVK